MKFCACIDTLYTELPWEKRFSAASRDGFESVEFWDWRVRDLETTHKAAEQAEIKISGFNGDADFSLVDPLQREDYLQALAQSLQAAKQLAAASVTIHSNALGEGGLVINSYDELSDTVKLCSMYEGLKQSAELAEKYAINLNLEGLNVKVDHVGNFLKTTAMAAELTKMIGSKRLRILYDAYHMQINEGDICGNLQSYIEQIGHVHVADVPGRHEPGTGELNYHNVFRKLISLGYKGRIGFELFPVQTTEKAVKAIMSYQE